MTNIYGIVGKKGHGKDTFSSLIHSENHKYSIHHFADRLKQIIVKIFGITEEQLFDPVLKETQLAEPIHIDMFVPALCKETGLSIVTAKKIALSPRQLMQYVGTDYIRKCNPNYWIEFLISRVGRQNNVIISDVRYENEAEAIRQIGGKIIKIVRLEASSMEDKHISEMEIDTICADLVILSKTGDLSLPKKIATLIAKGKFGAASKYNYDKAQIAIEDYLSGKSLELSSLNLGVGHKDPYVLKNLLEYYCIPIRRQSSNRISHTVKGSIVLKHCSKCDSDKGLSEFNSNSKAWDNLAGYCRNCCSKIHKDNYQKYSQVNTLEKIFQNSKKNSKYRGITFDITLAEIQEKWNFQKGLCWYSNQPMNFCVGDQSKVTFDRVDSSLGYHSNNVVLCCYRINIMKGNQSSFDFLKLVSLVYQHKCI